MSPSWFFSGRKLCNPTIAFVADFTVEIFAFIGLRKILHLAVVIPNEFSIILVKVDNQTLFLQEYGSGKDKVSSYSLLAQMQSSPTNTKGKHVSELGSGASFGMFKISFSIA